MVDMVDVVDNMAMVDNVNIVDSIDMVNMQKTKFPRPVDARPSDQFYHYPFYVKKILQYKNDYNLTSLVIIF